MIFLPVFRGRQPCVFFEAFAKIISVIISHLGGNIADFISWIGQKLFGLFHAVFCKVLIQCLTCFVFEKGTYIGCRQKYMRTDILYRKSVVGIVFTDIIFDQINRRVFLHGISGSFKEFSGFQAQVIMKFLKGKAFLQRIHNSCSLLVSGDLQLFFSLLYSTEQLVIQLFDLIGQKSAAAGVGTVQGIQKCVASVFALGSQLFQKILFRRKGSCPENETSDFSGSCWRRKVPEG